MVIKLLQNLDEKRQRCLDIYKYRARNPKAVGSERSWECIVQVAENKFRLQAIPLI